MHICNECQKSFSRKSDLTQHFNFEHTDKQKSLKKRSARSYSRWVPPKNLYEVSSRTAKKILNRLNIGCSNCGWDLAPCDTHHILERKNGGLNDHSNLAYLCPNCHRLAHYKLIENFTTLEEQIGDKWKQFYYSENKGMDK